MDNNGIPTIVTGHGDFASVETQNQIRSIETPQVTMGALAESILAANPENALVVVDPVKRKIYGFNHNVIEGPATRTEYAAKSLILGPVAGQTGRSLEWEMKSMDSGFPGLVEALVDSLLASAKPKRSVESLVSAILAAIPDETADADVPIVVINQETGTVKLCVPTDRSSVIGGLESAVGSATDAAILTLTEPAPEDEGPDPLIFEGGSTGA